MGCRPCNFLFSAYGGLFLGVKWLVMLLTTQLCVVLRLRMGDGVTSSPICLNAVGWDNITAVSCVAVAFRVQLCYTLELF
jgi:hypothetical protein